MSGICSAETEPDPTFTSSCKNSQNRAVYAPMAGLKEHFCEEQSCPRRNRSDFVAESCTLLCRFADQAKVRSSQVVVAEIAPCAQRRSAQSSKAVCPALFRAVASALDRRSASFAPVRMGWLWQQLHCTCSTLVPWQMEKPEVLLQLLGDHCMQPHEAVSSHMCRRRLLAEACEQGDFRLLFAFRWLCQMLYRVPCHIATSPRVS